MPRIQSFIKQKLIPSMGKSAYHQMRSFIAASANGFPAKNMIIIGITGTKGKTSGANYIWSVLNDGGYRVGLISTALYRFGDRIVRNASHMTMPSPFVIQQTLREMKEEGIRVAIVEMTSEGMKQYRHFGIPADIAIFTNLTPEHLASHNGSFEEYKKAKSPLFRSLLHPKKIVFGKEIPRVIIANADSEHSAYYLGFEADEKITFGIENGNIRAENIELKSEGAKFKVSGEEFETSIPGKFNIYNCLPAIITGTILDVDNDSIKRGVKNLTTIPGRMEKIDEGQNFKVYVDYAHEPASLEALLVTAENIKGENGKIVLLFGGQGGGRDPKKRAPMAALSAKHADYVIVTNEDPYEDDPQKIVDDIANLVKNSGKVFDQNLFSILDRREAIRKALSLAAPGDVILFAGKGSEETMMTKKGAVPWNEREIVQALLKEELEKRNK